MLFLKNKYEQLKVSFLGLQFHASGCSRAAITNFFPVCLFPALHYPFFQQLGGHAAQQMQVCPCGSQHFPLSSAWMLPAAALASVSLLPASFCPCAIHELPKTVCRAEIGNRFYRKIALLNTSCF